MRAAVIVAVGAALGASVRWAVGEMLATDPGAFPWATMIVNLAGCVAIGGAARSVPRDSDLWLGLVVGALGGLTTYSTFAVDARVLVEADRPTTAIAYVALSVVGGIAGTEIGRSGRERRS